MTKLIETENAAKTAAAGTEDEDKVKAEVEKVANWANERLDELRADATNAKEYYDEFKRVYDLEV
jgi:hypothetical protein